MIRIREDDDDHTMEPPTHKRFRLMVDHLPIDSHLVRFLEELPDIFMEHVVEEWYAYNTFVSVFWSLGIVSKNIRRSLIKMFGGSREIHTMLRWRAGKSIDIINTNLKVKYYGPGTASTLYDIYELNTDGVWGYDREDKTSHLFALLSDRTTNLFTIFFNERNRMFEPKFSRKHNPMQSYLIANQIIDFGSKRYAARDDRGGIYRIEDLTPVKIFSGRKLLMRTFEQAVAIGAPAKFLRDMYDGSVAQCMDLNEFDMDAYCSRIIVSCFLNDQETLPIDIFRRLLSFQLNHHFLTVWKGRYNVTIENDDSVEYVDQHSCLYYDDEQFNYLEDIDTYEAYWIIPFLQFPRSKPAYRLAMDREFRFRIDFMKGRVSISKKMKSCQKPFHVDMSTKTRIKTMEEEMYKLLETLNKEYDRPFNYIAVE